MSIVFVPSPSDTSTVESEFGDIALVSSKKYNRISIDTRDSLLAKIFFENKKIKIAAKELNMNYSTAKTILHLYRKKQKRTNKKIKEENRCHFRPLLGSSQGLEVVVSQGGKQMSSSNRVFCPKVTKNICKKPDLAQEIAGLHLKMALCQQLRQNMQITTNNTEKTNKKTPIKPSFINNGRTEPQKNGQDVRRSVIVIKPVEGRNLACF